MIQTLSRNERTKPSIGIIQSQFTKLSEHVIHYPVNNSLILQWYVPIWFYLDLSSCLRYFRF